MSGSRSTSPRRRPSAARSCRSSDPREPRSRSSGSANRDDRGAPRAAWSRNVDALADLHTHQRAAERRVRRDAADARDLDLHLLALLVLDLDDRADADSVRRGVLDGDGVLELVAEPRDPRLEQALLVLGCVVLEVLRQVAE